MTKNSKIEWTDHTFNPWIGCTKVGPGCDNCYAEGVAGRFKMAEWGKDKPRRMTSDSNWNEPLKWNDRARKSGFRYKVFCASMADIFDNEVPEEWRRRLWHLIEATPNLDWLILTKRIGNAAKMLPYIDRHNSELPSNIWLGATVVNQQEADRDIPKLLKIPAHIRFLSIEPMLGPIDLSLPVSAVKPPPFPDDLDEWPEEKREQWFNDKARAMYMAQCERIDWIIVGGESGKSARPILANWVRDIRDQCAEALVPFFFKQWGEWVPEGQINIAEIKSASSIEVKNSGEFGTIFRTGKKLSGRKLDGITHHAFPHSSGIVDSVVHLNQREYDNLYNAMVKK